MIHLDLLYKFHIHCMVLRSFGLRQFTALASIFAVDVFPVPLPPVKRYACPTLPAFI